MYYEDADGKRVYTLQARNAFRQCWDRLSYESLWQCLCLSRDIALQKTAPDGKPTLSAHPARFSPDDKFSRERLVCKKRFNLLPTQQPPLEL